MRSASRSRPRSTRRSASRVTASSECKAPGGTLMDAFELDPKDEYPHQPDASSNFNESVYTNAFHPDGQVGGWMRLRNRVNEGYPDLSVSLYLPGGPVACHF